MMMVIIIGDAYDNNDNDGNGDDDDDDDDADGRWQKFDDSTLWWVQLLPEATFGARSIQAGIIDLAILISLGIMIMMTVMMMIMKVMVMMMKVMVMMMMMLMMLVLSSSVAFGFR